MRILFDGADPTTASATVRALQAAGHDPSSDAAPVDAAIVDWTQGSQGIREAIGALKPDGHLLLCSTHAVYPSLPTTAPWTESAFHPAADFAAGATHAARLAREVERTLVVGEGRNVNWTILRPSIVDGADDPSDRTWWVLSRVMDGGPLIFPDDGPRLFRHIHADDLANAIALLVGDPRAYRRIVNVTGDGLLTPIGQALMLMDGLGRRVPVQWVPGTAWRNAGLPQPMGEAESSSFIESSPLLTELGWKAQPEVKWVETLARTLSLRAAPKPDEHQRLLERRVYQEALASDAFDITLGTDEHAPPLPRQWRVRASPSSPASLSFERFTNTLPAPIFKVIGVAFDDTVERLLSGDLPALPEPLVPGHAALLEVLEPGKTGFRPGDRVLPLSKMPCASSECEWCQDGVERFMGVDTDGFTASHVTLPASHLVAVPPSLGRLAILAHPLARLIEAFEPLLGESEGPVWILGTTAQARLAGFLARGAERTVVHLACTPTDGNEVIDDTRLQSVARAADRVKKDEAPRAGLCANMSSSRRGENLLMASATPEAKLLTPFGSDTDANLVVKLAPAARTQEALEKALLRLKRWSSFRDLQPLLSEPVDPRVALDALLAPRFQLGVVGGVE